jgi:tRNA-dependent cyclodipeptide synthase
MSQLEFQYFGGRAADLGRQIIEDGGHAVVGVSICNAFFKTEQCELLLKTVAEKFEKVTLYSCDIPYHHNLRALGYEESGIPKKVKKEIRSLRRKLRVAMQSLPQDLQDKLTDYGRFQNGPRFIEWEDIEKDKSYLSALAKMEDLFEANEEFKEDVLRCAESFMHGKIPDSASPEERMTILMESKNYVLKEWASFQVLPEILPKLVDSPKGKAEAAKSSSITTKGKASGYATDSTDSTANESESDCESEASCLPDKSLVYLYHRRVPLLETFLEGKYTTDPPYETMGHAVLGPDDDEHVNLYSQYLQV